MSEYIPYGPMWVQEMKKFTKEQLINELRQVWIKNESKKTQRNVALISCDAWKSNDSVCPVIKDGECAPGGSCRIMQYVDARYGLNAGNESDCVVKMAIKTKTLNDVMVQENGIIRDSSGLLIGRLVDDVKFNDVRAEDVAENKNAGTIDSVIELIRKYRIPEVNITLDPRKVVSDLEEIVRQYKP